MTLVLPTSSHDLEMDAQRHCERGFDHWQAWRLEEACREYTRAITLSPEHAPAYTGRGYVHHVNGDYNLAIADFTRAIQLDPYDSDAWKGRADSRQILGDYPNALADYDEAVHLCPRVAHYFHRRGDAHTATGDVDMAIDDYRRAVSLDPQNPVSHYFLADLLAEKQQYADAIEHYAEAIRIDPEHLDWFVYGWFAWILATCPNEGCRNGPKAVEMATIAYELDEQESIGILAAAHAANGNCDEAVKWQKRACELAEGNHKTIQRQRLELYELGKPLITTGRP